VRDRRRKRGREREEGDDVKIEAKLLWTSVRIFVDSYQVAEKKLREEI
jgi:hypothetical protein